MIETTIQNWTPTTNDMQGWNSQHEFLEDSIRTLKPSVILESGVWKGASVIHMAKVCKDLGIAPRIFALDTWLACDILRTVPEWEPSLRMSFNRPNIWQTFYDNVVREGVQDLIIPLHMDSRSGLRYLKRLGIKVDLFHHDSSHYEGDVLQDLELARDIMSPSHHIIVDDYLPSKRRWPDPCDFSGVVNDCDKFAALHKYVMEIKEPKARFVK
jgi:hypothetical protein